MMYIRWKFRRQLDTGISLLISLTLFILFTFAASAYTDEVPEKVYFGVDNASTLINNIDFRDVRSSRTWAKEAICEVGALDIIKGYGDKVFGRTNQVTKEQAIAIIYRAIGKEADAQKAAEALDNARDLEEKKTYAPGMWSDGYLQLAANEGLISQQDLEDAFSPDQSELEEDSFHKGAPAQRQEVADWMAKALGLAPVYGQQKIFNSFTDWASADPHKVPNIEAILVNNIMNGEGNGYFRPTDFITREQLAQIIKNASPKFFALLGYEKKIGTVEGVENSKDYTQGVNISRKTFNIRNSNGKLHKIVTESIDNQLEGYKNEQSGKAVLEPDVDLIVYKNGWVGKSSLLKEGDRIEYITAADGKVKFVKVISNTSDTKYIVAKVNKIDPQNLTLSISKIFDINYPDVNIESRNFSFNNSGQDVDVTYVLSNNAEVFIDGRKSDVKSIVPGTDAILAIKDNIITGINTVELRLKEQGVVSGIVEDINPQLGYITLYDEDGIGSTAVPQGKLPSIRTYNYSNPKNIKVLKNHKEGKIEDIEGGDSVYIKLDDKGNVEAISGVDNYVVKHAKVISKGPGVLTVRYDDGIQQILYMDKSIPVILDKKVVSYDTLKDGDKVKLLLNITDRFTKLKQITIEGNEHYIANIYKGVVANLDDISNRLVLQNLELFQNGKWVRTEQKGFTTLGLTEGNTFVYNNGTLNTNTVKKLFLNHEAYIAVEKDYGGDEKAVFISFRNKNDSEVPVFDDSVASNTTGREGEIILSKEYKNIAYGQGTIVVKDNRLVTGYSIAPEDTAYIVANRSYDDGSFYASVVSINDRAYPDFIKIYRARIASIDENKDFKVESFSELKGLTWEYYNTPKTFRLTYDSRIIDDNGVVGQRNFTDYGDSNFKDRTAYVLSNGSDAVLINTVPYGNVNAKGEIYDISGGNPTEGEGAQNKEPTGFKLLNAKIYDAAAHIWVDSKDMTLNILKNSIILKNNSIAKPSDLKKGDKVRVIKKESNETGDAYIIFVE
ncbi:MAG: S-layer homology domain-containing protein [Bacillota bacterium]